MQHGIGHFFQCIFLGVVYVFLQRRQRVDECDGTAGFKVDAGVITSAAVADVLTFLEAVRFQQGVYGRHVVFAPYVHLNVVDFVYNAVADVQIFFPLIQQFIKFCVVGGSGVFIDFGITYLCKEWLRLNKYLANSLGFLCASTSNYVLNRIWTFHNENPDIAGQYLRFLGIAAVGLVINNLTIYLLHERWKLNFYLAKLFAIGVVTFWNFFMNYFFTF